MAHTCTQSNAYTIHQTTHKLSHSHIMAIAPYILLCSFSSNLLAFGFLVPFSAHTQFFPSSFSVFFCFFLLIFASSSAIWLLLCVARVFNVLLQMWRRRKEERQKNNTRANHKIHVEARKEDDTSCKRCNILITTDHPWHKCEQSNINILLNQIYLVAMCVNG